MHNDQIDVGKADELLIWVFIFHLNELNTLRYVEQYVIIFYLKLQANVAPVYAVYYLQVEVCDARGL